MKSINSSDDSFKLTQNKSNKKSTKSRSKSSRIETVHNATNPTNSGSYVPNTPTTPTSNIFDTAPAPGSGSTPPDLSSGGNSGNRSHPKNYAGFDPHSIRIIWEQHDQSDVELSEEVCTCLAEDASFKMWELINNIKTYARHSGSVITYGLVNEVLCDADVPPSLGATESPWDRIDYDGSFYFYSDKILELRDEYQKEINIEMPLGADFERSGIMEDKHVESMRKYIPSLVNVILYGENSDLELALHDTAISPVVAAGFRVLVAKIIQILAYKQTDPISIRCWALLRSCAVNPFVREIDCRRELYYLAEILICQLVGPLECIKVHNEEPVKVDEKSDIGVDVKPENVDNMKSDVMQQQTNVKSDTLIENQDQLDELKQKTLSSENIFRLQPDEDGTLDADIGMNTSTSSTTVLGDISTQFSPYFASPVDLKNIEELCCTIGLLGTLSGYFQSECLFLMKKRLERFFEGRVIATEKEYNYIGRSLRGLISLGEYAFREFIPFIFKFKADDIPENLWNDLALSATFIHGPDDIFLYQWLEYVCGGDKLQPFMVYYAEYHEKLLTMRYLRRKRSTFKIIPKLGARRLEWSTVAAAMCHGDDPNKAFRTKHKILDVFPDLVVPNLHLNRPGNIRFKFAGCRPVILRPKTNAPNSARGDNNLTSETESGHHDIIIAKRKLFNPLTNERRIVPLSSFFYTRI